MKRNLLEQAAGFIKRQRNRQRWYKVFSVMAAVVVFVTTYALILPAITMERPAICGMEAHVHTADCYARTADGYACMADLQLHTHTDVCYDEQENLVCGYADFVLHTHNEFCYDADGNLVCPLDEVTSYTVEQPVLAEEETGDAATGSALAFIMEELHGDTIEYTEPHAHSEDCYDERGRLVCGQLEVQAHQHDATCLADDARICGLEEHQHTDACYETEEAAEQQPDADIEYICGMEEHTHGESCYDENGELICGLEEHQHSEACSSVSEEQLPDAEPADTESGAEAEPGDSTTEQSPDEAVEYICGLEAHSHDEACYNENGELICILPEHTHSEACGTIAENETPLAAVEPSVFTAEDDKVVVTVTVPAGVQLPEGSKLEIKPLAADGDDYQATVQAGEELLRQAQPQANILQHLVYDISLVCDGVEIEPEGGAVEVCISLKPNTLLTEEPSATVQVYHMAQEPELLETEVESEADGTVNVNFATESFSEYGIMLLSTDAATDTGAFKYTDDTVTITLQLDSTYYTTDKYTLNVEKKKADDYENALQIFTSHGQVIKEAVIYKIYLIQNDNKQTHTNLNCGYTLNFSWPEGLFTEVTGDDFLDYVYNKNSNSEPTALNNLEVTCDESSGNVIELSASESYWPNSAEFMFVRSSAPNGLIAGSSKLTYNSVKDAFITDSAYSKYYNANSPIGTAGSFHIVAFNEAHLLAHTNGNVLAKTLYAGSNFGTNNYADELSYIQSYAQINATSASNEQHLLALGSENTITFEDNGNAFGVNGTKIDKPKNFVQDKDTNAAPLIDLNRVEQEISQIAGNLAGFMEANLTYTTGGSYNTLMLNDPDAVGVANYTAAELGELGSYLRLDGFQSGHSGSVVINVDCAGISELNMPQARIVIDGQEVSVNEVIEFSAGKVIWNFTNAQDTTIITHLMTGIILAPGATVNINENLNGTVVAKNVYVKAESHRSDFTGKITEPNPDDDNCKSYITVQKTETGYAGKALPGAQFDLYKWEGDIWKQINTEPLKTNDHGTFMLHNLAASTAYKLVELVPPDGYVKSEEPFNFWVKTDKNQTQPNSKPDGFNGTAVEVGGTLLAANDVAVTPDYTLPQTGGPGTTGYILAGLLLMAAATMLLYKQKQRGREEL